MHTMMLSQQLQLTKSSLVSGNRFARCYFHLLRSTQRERLVLMQFLPKLVKATGVGAEYSHTYARREESSKGFSSHDRRGVLSSTKTCRESKGSILAQP